MKRVLLIALILGLFGFGCSNKNAADVYLSIRPREFVENVNVIHKDLNGDLVIVLKSNKPIESQDLPKSVNISGKIIDVTGTTSYLNENMLKTYGLTKEKLFEIGLRNFDNQQFGLQVASDDEGKPQMVMPNWDESSRYGEDIQQSHLLSDASLQTIKDNLGEEFYVRLSTYEFFIAFRKDISKESWDSIKETILEAYQNEPHPLSNKLFLYRKGSFIPVEDRYINP